MSRLIRVLLEASLAKLVAVWILFDAIFSRALSRVLAQVEASADVRVIVSQVARSEPAK